MAKRAIVMYLEQARIYGEDLCVPVCAEVP